MVEESKEIPAQAEQQAEGAESYLSVKDGRDHGHTEPGTSWTSLLGELGVKGDIAGSQLSEAVGDRSGLVTNNDPEHLPSMMFDEYNCELFDNVHPMQWVDPQNDQGKYDMLVIGGGAGGLVTAAGSAGVGARVAIIERNFLGGDCLNNGCVPSKAFLKCANVANAARTADQYGIEIEGEIKINFKSIMARMRKIRAQISENDSAQRFSTTLGIDVYMGNAKFSSENTVEVNGKTLTFNKACIATGGRPNIPDLNGIETVPYHTSDNIWNLVTQPTKVAVIGSGPIGAELGQAFQRLGSQVTFVCRGPNFLPREDRDAANILVEQLTTDGCNFKMSTAMNRVELLEAGNLDENNLPKMRLHVTEGGEDKQLDIDLLLFATGRKPNVNNMGLEVAKVDFSERDGIYSNAKMCTSNSKIFTVGDCAAAAKNAEEAKTNPGPGPQFTHNSDVMARSVVRNALFFGGVNRTEFKLPWATYTEPEIAHVGAYPWQLEERNINFDTFTKPFSRCDRAICEGNKGFIKVHVVRGSDIILGATAAGGPAGELISLITAGMTNNLGLQKIGQGVYPYPTYAEGIKHLADQYTRTTVGGKTKMLISAVNTLRK